MDRDKWYKILGCYLRQYLSVTLIFFGFIGIFSMIFRLYDLKVEAVLYASGLCLLQSFFLCIFFSMLEIIVNE